MMRSISLLTTALAASSLASAQNSTTKCYDGLKMFVSRGSLETINDDFGATYELVKLIKDQIEDSDMEAIHYPATFSEPSYFDSVMNGTSLLKKAIIDYIAACPGKKMALFGYSQGGQVTTNTICGTPIVWAAAAGAAELWEAKEFASGLIPETFTDVVSAVVFGDPSHRADVRYNYGNSTGTGMFWRDNIKGCAALGSRIRSYCMAGDPFCSTGPDGGFTMHGRYIDEFSEEVVKYVVGQYENGGADLEARPTSTPPQNGAAGIVPKLVAAAVMGLATVLAM